MEEQLYDILKLLVSIDPNDLNITYFVVSDNHWDIKIHKTEYRIKIVVLYEQFSIITMTVPINAYDVIGIYTINNHHMISSLNDFDNDIVSFTLINGRVLTKISRYIITAFFLDYEFLKQSIEEFLSNNEYFRRTIN